MKPFKFFLISVFVFTLIFSASLALATEQTNTGISQTPIATVNIINPKITSNDKNVYNISFALTNDEGLQSGVRYGVKLYSINEKGEPVALVDENVYPEVLSLQPKSTVEKSITYSAPEMLDGSYLLALSSENESGFPFGLVIVDKVKLTSLVKGVEILPESCSAKVEPKSSDTSGNLTLGPNDTVLLTCTAVNSKDSAISVVPFFETTYRSLYGEVVTANGGDTKPITFNKLEKKTFSVVLPKGEKSQVYYVKTMLKDGDSYSNAISTTYTISGVNASIQNIFFDKDYYQRGDTAKLSLLWTSAGALDTDISLSLALTDKNGKDCGPAVNQTLTESTKNIKTEIPFTIKKSCFNPTAVVSILDSSGSILDQKTFKTETVSVKDTSGNTLLIIIILIAVLIILGIGFYLKKKKGLKSENANNIPPIAIVLLLIACSFIPFNFAKASTFSFGLTGAYATTSLDKTTYSPGNFTPAGSVVVTTTFYLNGVSASKLTFSASTNGTTQFFDTSTSVPISKSFATSNTLGWSAMSFVLGNATYNYRTYLVNTSSSCNLVTHPGACSPNTCIDSTTLLSTDVGKCSVCTVGSTCLAAGVNFGTVLSCDSTSGMKAVCSGGTQTFGSGGGSWSTIWAYNNYSIAYAYEVGIPKPEVTVTTNYSTVNLNETAKITWRTQNYSSATYCIGKTDTTPSIDFTIKSSTDASLNHLRAGTSDEIAITKNPTNFTVECHNPIPEPGFCSGSYNIPNGYCGNVGSVVAGSTGSRGELPGPYEGVLCSSLTQALCGSGWITHPCSAWHSTADTVKSCSGFSQSACLANSGCVWNN